MAETSKIEWCDSTLNPWIGCTRVSPACDDCYAARSTPARTMGIVWGPGEARHRTSASAWNHPRAWNRKAEQFHLAHGHRQRVFCASLADVFDNEVDPTWRADLMQLIADTPRLDWLVLTKRIGNAQPMLDAAVGAMSGGKTTWSEFPWPNVWLGSTVVTQEEIDRDVPKLLATPAAVRFLSIEPLLEPVDLFDHLSRAVNGFTPRLDWVIAGGESGSRARTAQPDWFRTIRNHCKLAGVAFFMKQMTRRLPIPDDLLVRQFPNTRQSAAQPEASA